VTADADSDSDDWASVVAGDALALGELFDRHHARVYSRALWLLGNFHDAQDATAVAFLELWRRRADVRVVHGSVLPWLLVTTSNVCRNATRATRRYDALLANLPRGATEPSAELTAITSADLLDAIDPELAMALGRLNRDTYALLIITAIDGVPIADAATAVGISVGSAKTRLSRARRLLRDLASAARIPTPSEVE
jgi:RNA polymerase sigma factor (sigma-70 family)